MHLCVFRRVSFISLCWKRLAEALWLLYVLCEKKMFYVLFILSDDG